MEFTFTENNRCVICKDFVGSKKASKVIHIRLQHKKILDILDEELGKNGYLKNENEEFFEDETSTSRGCITSESSISRSSRTSISSFARSKGVKMTQTQMTWRSRLTSSR